MEEREIKIINGNGKDLNISDVSTHISSLKPKTKSKNEKGKKIVIPKAAFDLEEDNELDESKEKENQKN